MRMEAEEAEEERGWTHWLRAKESQLRLTEECIPGDLKKLTGELDKCDQ